MIVTMTDLMIVMIDWPNYKYLPRAPKSRNREESSSECCEERDNQIMAISQNEERASAFIRISISMICSLSNYTQDLLLLAISKSNSDPLRLEVADRPFVNKCFHKEEKKPTVQKPLEIPLRAARGFESSKLWVLGKIFLRKVILADSHHLCQGARWFEEIFVIFGRF